MKKITILLVCVWVSFNATAQDDVFTSHDIFKMSQVGSVTISPNGKYIAYSKYVPRPWTDKPGGSYAELHVLNRNTGKTTVYINNKERYSSLGWTPDSRYVTMLARFNDTKKSQVWKVPIGGGAAEQVTDASHSISSYHWNPKGGSIAYIASEKDKSRAKEKKQGFNQEIYEEEWVHKNVYVWNIKKGSSEQLTENKSAFGIRWNPAGTSIAAAMADRNLTDDSYMFKKIYLIDPKGGDMKQLVDNPGKLGSMEWSPDGRHLAFVSAIDITDPVNGSLYITAVPNSKKFSELKNYSKDFKGSVTSVKWKDSKTVLFSADENVNTVISAQRVGSDSRAILLAGGKATLASFTYGGGVIAFSGSTPKHPNELFTLVGKKLTRHTNSNPWLDKKRLSRQEQFDWKSRDGWDMSGVLLYPLDYEAGKKYPMISYIHGGPEACVKNGWSTYYSMWGQVATAKGYFVFMPNYRGSSGKGVAFSKADQGDMGDEEFNDVLDGIKTLADQGMVDQSKVGIGGGSYGGYFAAWGATKHTEHFAASVMFVGISDQISKRYTTDIPYESKHVHWTKWVHEDYDLMFDRSPIKYITQSKTPTLILHGKEDPRVHPSQSLELYRGLKLHGKAPVRLIWYPGEGHGNRKNPARLDYNLRTLAWFDYYLKGEGPADQMPEKYLDYGIEKKEENKKAN